MHTDNALLDLLSDTAWASIFFFVIWTIACIIRRRVSGRAAVVAHVAECADGEQAYGTETSGGE